MFGILSDEEVENNKVSGVPEPWELKEVVIWVLLVCEKFKFIMSLSTSKTEKVVQLSFSSSSSSSNPTRSLQLVSSSSSASFSYDSFTAVAFKSKFELDRFIISLSSLVSSNSLSLSYAINSDDFLFLKIG